MNMRIPAGQDPVAKSLKTLESNFELSNPMQSRLAATELGRALASLAVVDTAAFAAADKRLTSIAERLIGNSMGSVLGAVERAFHDEVSSQATKLDVLKDNARAKRERGA